MLRMFVDAVLRWVFICKIVDAVLQWVFPLEGSWYVYEMFPL